MLEEDNKQKNLNRKKSKISKQIHKSEEENKKQTDEESLSFYKSFEVLKN